jgi:hypothetical protein
VILGRKVGHHRECESGQLSQTSQVMPLGVLVPDESLPALLGAPRSRGPWCPARTLRHDAVNVRRGPAPAPSSHLPLASPPLPERAHRASVLPHSSRFLSPRAMQDGAGGHSENESLTGSHCNPPPRLMLVCRRRRSVTWPVPFGTRPPPLLLSLLTPGRPSRLSRMSLLPSQLDTPTRDTSRPAHL